MTENVARAIKIKMTKEIEQSIRDIWQYADDRFMTITHDVIDRVHTLVDNRDDFQAGTFFIIGTQVVNLLRAMVCTGGNPDKLTKQQREDQELFCTLYAYNLMRAMDDPDDGHTCQVDKRAAEMFEKVTGRKYDLS